MIKYVFVPQKGKQRMREYNSQLTKSSSLSLSALSASSVSVLAGVALGRPFLPLGVGGLGDTFFNSL